MYPKEYIQYLVHFHGDRDYFECHEILEEFWRKKDPGNKFSIWVGFIQLAVTNYHHRIGNFNGAKKTLKKAINIFHKKEKTLSLLGIESQSLFVILNERLDKIEKKQVYKDFNLPIYDLTLLNQCKFTCNQVGFPWGGNGSSSDLQIVFRHKLRDRTKVIQARQNAIFKRKDNE